jgi:glucosamine--fructose-6-phosphate aminotransferase (isomerizing)
MCGIVGAVSTKNITSILIEGLKKLEYRGYDSAGMCVMHEKHHIQRLRALGKVHVLEELLEKEAISGTAGIAHTRWATHGVPSEHNAHPLMSGDKIAVVHNGIIENYLHLRERLEQEGYQFSSETDTEVAAHLIDFYLKQVKDFLVALRLAASEMQGAFALGVLSGADPDVLGVVRQGSPLVIGIGNNEHFIASDPLAVMPSANKFIYLEDGDIALITSGAILITDNQGQAVERPVQTPLWGGEGASKGHYRHFMLKEIIEQPHVIAETLEGRSGQAFVFPEILGTHANTLLENTKMIQIVACGTSYHAGLVARYWFEQIAKIPCQVDVASEFRYRSTVVVPGTLLITISQSGETADTLAALRHAKTQGYAGFLAICNVPGSSLVRESECVLMTRAGMEIGVASTKAFTSQLTAFLLLALLCGHFRQEDPATLKTYLDELKKLPALCEKILKLNAKIQHMARAFEDKQHALFLGRGIEFPIALEGALKLKEISYIHAEAYPAGELKHGPLALVDKNMPIIIIAAQDELLPKLKSNIEEVRARGGECFIFTDESTDFENEKEMHVIKLPPISPIIAPIAYTIPLQLLAYHVAVLKGTDVDQPRNLAKSVTVE